VSQFKYLGRTIRNQNFIQEEIKRRLNSGNACYHYAEWRKMHNKKFRDLYSSTSIIRIIKSKRMRWAGHVARMGEKRNTYRLLVGKPEGKRPLGRRRHRWVDNIRMDLGEVGWGDIRVPQNAGKL
jgi:hypothetical protein